MVALTLSGAAAAAPLEVIYQSDGTPGAAYDGLDTPLDAGDDTLRLEQTVTRVEVRANTDNSILGSPLGPVLLAANLREARVDHPAFRLVRGLDEATLDAAHAPLDVEFTEQGFGVGWDLPVRNGHRDPEPISYPDPEDWYNFPLVLTYDSVGVEPSLLGSSDRFLARADAEAGFLCTDVQDPQRGNVPLGLGCPSRALSDTLTPVLPNVAGRNEIWDVGVGLDVPPDDIAIAQPGTGARAPGVALGAAGDAVPQGAGDEPAPAAVDPVLPDSRPSAAHAEESTGLSPSAAASSLVDEPDAQLALAVLAGLGLALLGVPLYRRIVKGQLMQNPMREAIVGLVGANPGIHEMAVATELGISHTLTQYHVRMLAEFGAVELKRFGGRKCLFLPGTMGRTEKSLLLAERGGKGGEVLALVGRQPGVAQRDLARQLGIRESSVKWHLDRLEQQGLLAIERGPAGKRVRLTPDAERALGAPPPTTFTRVPSAEEPRPEPEGPPAPMDPRAPAPLHAVEA
jgi:biotin operon repressor